MAKSSERPLAVFQIRKNRRIGDFIFKVRGILITMGKDTITFSNPSPTLVNAGANVDLLEAAETQVHTRTVGTASTRDLAYDVVLEDVHKLQNYVQDLADAAANPAEAISIITLSGFHVKVKGQFIKPLLAAKNGRVPGSVQLTAQSAGKRAGYIWQQSLDNGLTWEYITFTLVANTIASGFTAGSRVSFRFASVTKAGVGDWCIPITLIIR